MGKKEIQFQKLNWKDGFKNFFYLLVKLHHNIKLACSIEGVNLRFKKLKKPTEE